MRARNDEGEGGGWEGEGERGWEERGEADASRNARRQMRQAILRHPPIRENLREYSTCKFIEILRTQRRFEGRCIPGGAETPGLRALPCTVTPLRSNQSHKSPRIDRSPSVTRSDAHEKSPRALSPSSFPLPPSPAPRDGIK